MTTPPALYVFDPEDPRWRRPWEQILPVPFREAGIGAGRFTCDDEPIRDGVVVVHASRLPAGPAQSRLFDGAAADGLRLILISGGHQPPDEDSPAVYRRRSPVRVREMDGEFRECFQRFWDHLTTLGEVRFELLEPPRGMVQVLAVLCQGYLLAHALERNDATAGDTATHAAEILTGLGLAEDGATRPGDGTDMRPVVEAGDWWQPIDLEELQRELDFAGASTPAVDELVVRLRGRETVDGPTVVAAYRDLAAHLRGGTSGA